MNRGKERRKTFLAKMSREAIESYDDAYRDWYDDEKELLPHFLSLLGSRKRILDLAGGYAKAVTALSQGENTVVLADMSGTSLRDGKAASDSGGAQFVRLDMLDELPFVDEAFDGIWFAEAFEYVPPDMRNTFLVELRRIVKDGGIIFLSAEGLSRDTTIFDYLRNYFHWKVIKRAPVVWGEYIYMLDLPKYKGWHYHALVLGRRFDRQLRAAGFDMVSSKRNIESGYSSYVLRAVRTGLLEKV